MILNVQSSKQSEVPDLRWDGAGELIRVEIPEKARVNIRVCERKNKHSKRERNYQREDAMRF